MIYLAYLDDRDPTSETSRLMCRELLDYGLFCELGIRLSGQEIIRNPWGKPFLKDHADVHFNLSSCRGLAACAIAGVPVGIDVERVRRFSPWAARHAFSDSELQALDASDNPDRLFFQLWTLKESCIKAMGMGLSHPMKQVVFGIENGWPCRSAIIDYTFLLFEDGDRAMMAAAWPKDAGAEWMGLEVVHERIHIV